METVRKLIMIVRCINSMRSILKRHIGSAWMPLLAKSFTQSDRLLANTRWNGRKDDEARHVKSISPLAAIYFNLQEKLGKEKALEISGEVIIKASLEADYSFMKKYKMHKIKDPFERWKKYRKALACEEKFNETQDIEVSECRLHYIVKRCIYNDFFTEVGAPELTGFICESDRIFFSDMLFRDLNFHRGDSWRNTIGYGSETCCYIWEPKREPVNTGSV